MTTFAARARQFNFGAAQIARVRCRSDDAVVLEQASAGLQKTGHYHWEGGTTLCTFLLQLHVPA